MLSRESLGQHGLNEDSVRERVRAEPGGSNARAEADIRSDYISLRKSDGVYAFGEGLVDLAAPNGQRARFTLQFGWPKKAPPGTYQVRVYEVRHGSVIHEISLPIDVVRTGFPAWLAGIAGNRPAVYGITAVLAGVFAGFGVDFLATRIFRRKRLIAH